MLYHRISIFFFHFVPPGPSALFIPGALFLSLAGMIGPLSPGYKLRILCRLRHRGLRRHRDTHDRGHRRHVTPGPRRERVVVRPPVLRDVPQVVPAHVSSLLAHGTGEAIQVGAEVVNLLLVSVARKGETPAHGTVGGA